MMKIEAGKYYRTRKDMKVFIHCLSKCESNCLWLGEFILENNLVDADHWYKNGLYAGAGTETSPYDLVEEWREYESLEVQISLYREGGGIFCSFGNANSNKEWKLVGTKTVTLKEGEFADED
jgi:hypothetical protein